MFLAHVYMLQVQHVDMSSELKPSSYNSSKTQRHWMEMGQKQQLLQLWSTGTTHRMQVGGGVATDQYLVMVLPWEDVKDVVHYHVHTVSVLLSSTSVFNES